MKLKDLTIRISHKKQSNYLSSPTKYFFPMNCADSSKTFITLTKKKPVEKIPDFLKEIISSPPSKPRARSQIKASVMRKSDQSFMKKKNFLGESKIFHHQQNSESKIHKSFERILYKPINLRINPRSKVTLFTVKSFRNGSEARIVSSSKCLNSSSNLLKKIQNRSKFVIPEFTEKQNPKVL